jgi:hypothetical protein
MAGDEEVTLGEVYRLILGLQKDFRESAARSMSLQLWEVEKRSFEEKFASQGGEIAKLQSQIETAASAKDHEHKALNAAIMGVREESAREIKNLEVKNGEQAEVIRRNRVQQWFAIGIVILTAIIGVVSNLVTDALQGGGS